MAETKVTKEAGRTIVSNTSQVSLKITKRNSHQGLALPASASKNNFVGFPKMSTVTITNEDYEFCKKHKVFKAAVENGDLVINNSRMPNREPAKVLSKPEVPNDLKNKKSKVAENQTPNGVSIEPLDNIEG
jgi:hypothetical protein